MSSRASASVVALAGQDGQALAPHPHLNGMMLRAPVRSAWGVAQGVLVAGFLGHARVQLLHRPAFQSVVDVVAGIVRIFRNTFEFPFNESSSYAAPLHRIIVPQRSL